MRDSRHCSSEDLSEERRKQQGQERAGDTGSEVVPVGTPGACREQGRNQERAQITEAEATVRFTQQMALAVEVASKSPSVGLWEWSGGDTEWVGGLQGWRQGGRGEAGRAGQRRAWVRAAGDGEERGLWASPSVEP